MELKNGLPTTKESSELTVKDCLVGRPIVHLVKYGGKLEITKRVDLELTVCLELLQVSLSGQAVKLLVGDMIKKYECDSLEDILCCLRDGRNGKFGEIYGKFNMIVFSKWMRKHLDEKAGLREAKIYERDNAHNWESREDYLESVKAGDEMQKAIKKIEQKRKKKIHEGEMKEFDYQKFKGEYLEKQSEAEKLEEVEVSGEK